MITDEVKYNPQSSTHPIQMNKTVYFFIGWEHPTVEQWKIRCFLFTKITIFITRVKNLIATIQRLEHEVGEWRKRCRKAEREKEALQKENAELKAEKAVADRVMQTKLNLSPQEIDIMKSQAAQELAREQRDKDDDVLGF